MKKIYSIALLFFFTAGIAKFSGYYDSATGTNYTLKTQLYNIIKGMLTTDMVDYIPSTNRCGSFLRNDGTILDMYSENPNATDPYNYSTNSTQRCGNYSTEEIAIIESISYRNQHLTQRPNGF
jgi:hypothetical protein